MPENESKNNKPKKPKPAKKPKVTQRTLTDWIFKTYEIDVLPKQFYYNLAKIKKGEYKGQNKPIPIADLYDMWQRSMPKLEKVYLNNCSKGKMMEGYLRIQYDLTIVLSRYSSYLAWKAEQEAKRNEEENKATEVEYIKACRQLEENRKNNAEELPKRKVLYKSSIDDLSEVLDEMWVKHD